MQSYLKPAFLIKHTKKLLTRCMSTQRKCVILGIETSCDDTGCAIVDDEGNILGEALNTQQLIHLNNGGIIPPIARKLHRQNIEGVVEKAMKNSGLSYEDISAIATTVKPGLPMSLAVGAMYGKYLCKKYKKPFIPIHHMEAHALTARMMDKSIEFPFLVLLISGGHCLLSIARNVDDFLLLGQSLDDAPGEAFDKTARRLKLRNIPEFHELSGGQAIELAASKADDMNKFHFSIPLTQYRDCNFSMAGAKNKVLTHLLKEERELGIQGDEIIPNVYNLCASFLVTITRHLCHRVQRGMEYAALKNLIPKENKTLVVSGGVACNNFIAEALQFVCDEMGYRFVRPPPKLCTDNGVMIAWNGVERWKINSGVTEDLDSIRIEKDCPLGTSLIEDVTAMNIKCDWVKLSYLNKQEKLKAAQH